MNMYRIKQIAKRLSLVLIMLLGLSSCTNSPLAWKLLYGQFDSFLSRELLSYADFGSAQKITIRSAVDATVTWHKTQELPLYAKAMDSFQAKFLSRQPETNDIEWLFSTIRDIGLRFDANSPLLKLIPLIANMSDQQISQVADQIDEEFAEEKKEWQKDKDLNPAQRSTKSMVKFFKRMGVKLNENQKNAITIKLGERKLSREQQQVLWRKWSDQLLIILENRSATDFSDKFKEHHFARISLFETQAPDLWRQDQTMFKELLLQLFASMDKEQISNMDTRIEKYKKFVLELSQEK